jgi:hypothetical protein
MHIANYLVSRMQNVMIRARTRASVVTDRLRNGKTNVVTWCDWVKGSVFTSVV